LNKSAQIHEDLVIRAQKGDPLARAGLYQLFSKAMYNICIRMTGNKADAEDVLQDVFVYAFEHIGQVREPAAFGGWLRKIVVADCIRKTKQQFRWNDLDDSHGNMPQDDDEDWWTSVQPEQIHEAIKLLPNGCRQVFVLFVLEELGHRQIAESLGISESTSKSQYQRARQLLKERITRKISING
jgi:RNA polymerase sigma factor (sigma-70 family)